ncbi:MAG: hypothetical protein M1814_005717 [Vezdaea aestivalis]|nr:MAG: hypothetical protein M1814_005717 [Vezdaea aestivalis]
MDFLNTHPFVRATILDRAHGIMTGSALGDTIGLYTEFLPKTLAESTYPTRQFSLLEPPTVRKGDHHRDGFAERSWTDDTDHALLIVLSILRNEGRTIPNDFAARLLSWAEQGLRCLDRLPLGLGRTVKTVILTKDYVVDPAAAARAYWLKAGKNAAANGALMRTHPLGIVTIGATDEARFALTAAFAATTHTDPRCVVSCCVATAVVAKILRGEITSEMSLDRVIEEAYQWVVKNYSPDPEAEGAGLERDEFEKHVYAKSLLELQLDDGQKLGYTYKCLAAGILCLRLAMQKLTTDLDVFESIMIDLIMEGGDADTNAACAGALVGAWVGFSRLPTHWAGGLRDGQWLLKKTDAFCQVVGITERNQYVSGEDQDTLTDKERGLLGRDVLERREQELLAHILTRDKERKDAQAAKKKKSSGLGRFFSSS